MMTIPLLIAIIAGIFTIGCVIILGSASSAGQASQADVIKLPAPSNDSNTSVEQALSRRRSVREYAAGPLTLAEVSQLLWAAQGVTDPSGFRTAPSAGALYPLEVYLVVGNVKGLNPAVYKYDPGKHSLTKVADGDRRADLSRVALGQSAIGDAAIDLVIAGVYERATWKYNTPVHDERTGSDFPAGVKYVHMEAGHASQNVYLESVSLGLGAVTMGAFSDEGVRRVTGMPDEERPLYVMPVGRA